jgi:hypothetical protein
MVMMMMVVVIIAMMMMVVMVPILRQSHVWVPFGLRHSPRCVRRLSALQQGDRIRDRLDQLRIRPGAKTSAFCAADASTVFIAPREDIAPTRPAIFLSMSTSTKKFMLVREIQASCELAH